MSFTYAYPRPSVTVDVLLYRRDRASVLLIQRKHPPFQLKWALPGGFVDQDEGLETAALRELLEETGLKDLNLIQLGAYGDPGRDPRGHTITIVYGGIITEGEASELLAGDDAREARWFRQEALPDLAFDHDRVISECLPKLLNVGNNQG